MDGAKHNSGSIIIEEPINIAGLRCHILQSSSSPSADLAPVHSSSKHKIRMSEDTKISNEINSESIAHCLSNTLKEKLALKGHPSNCSNKSKNGLNLRLGTTDVEVHCTNSRNPTKDIDKQTILERTLSQNQTSSSSSHESELSYVDKFSNIETIHASNTDKINLQTSNSSNGPICNGCDIPETTENNLVMDISFSSDKSNSQDSSYSGISTGARPRRRNTSNSSSSYSIQPQSECDVDLSSYASDCSKLQSLDSNLSCVAESLSSIIDDDIDIKYMNYENEYQMESIMKLIQRDLSEPYSIYTYRYFIHNWPKLCFLACVEGEIIGAIVCKLDLHKKVTVRGYIAMLAVDQRFRKRKIGSNLVQRAIREMAADDADEVVLETEITNKSALQLYENLGFVRDKRLFRYYLNGVDALRLKLWLS